VKWINNNKSDTPEDLLSHSPEEVPTERDTDRQTTEISRGFYASRPACISTFIFEKMKRRKKREKKT